MTTQSTPHGSESATEHGAGADRVRPILIGEYGFERATVWSAVGFALVLGANAAVHATLLPPAATTWIAIGMISVVTLSIVAFALIGGGLGPCIILAAGPLMATWVGVQPPTLSPIPLIESFAIGLGLALTIGLFGYLVGAGGGRLYE